MRRGWNWLLAVTGGLVLGGCGGTGAGSAVGGPVDVEVAVAGAGDVPVVVSTVASLDARHAADLRAQVAGQIGEILHDEGSRVAEGTSILTIDPERYRLAFQSAAARLEQATVQYRNDSLTLERSRPLVATGGLGEQGLDDLETRAQASKAALDQARAARDLAERDYHNSTVRAPFAGRFAERQVNVGDYARVGDPIGTVADASVLLLTFDLPETQGVNVSPGDSVRFEATALPDRTFAGTVYYVSPIVTDATRTVTIKARVDNRDGALRPGMSANVHVTTSVLHDAMVIPETAIRREAGEQYVFRVSADTARRVHVTLGPRPRSGEIVVNEIGAGDSVVVAGFQKITDGSAVRATIAAALGDSATGG